MALLLGGGVLAGAPQQLPSTPIAPQLAELVRGLSLWWTGNAGWLVRSGEVLIGFRILHPGDSILQRRHLA